MATSTPVSTGAFAADYVGHGFALCPIPRGKKGTNTKGWNLRQNAITDGAVASRLAGNVGLLHAFSGTAALDVDDAEQAKKWLLERGVDLCLLMSSPDYVSIISGREGRGKLLYRLPSDIASMQTLQIKGVSGEVILEFRCADSGGNSVQDVLPPSIHPDTDQPYHWGGPGNWRSLPVIPQELLLVWQAALAVRSSPKSIIPSQSGTKLQNLSSHLPLDTPENRAELARLLDASVNGCPVFNSNSGRDDWLRDLWSIAAIGEWTYEVAREWSRKGDTFDMTKFEQDWNSFDPNRPQGITAASFFAKLRNAGVQHSLNISPASAPKDAAEVSVDSINASELVPCTSLMNLPHTMTAELAVEVANRYIGFAHDWGGKPTLFRIDADGCVYGCARDEVRALLANKSVDKGDGIRKPLFPIWETSPQKRTVAKVIFDPTGRSINDNGEPLLNLWRGFARNPRPGTFDKMIMHLHAVICDGDESNLHYLLAWMAHLVQRPWEAPGVVIVLRSQREGTGKTTVLSWLAAMLGVHALMLSEPTQLLGRFNAHIETLSFVGLNELGWAGDKDAASKLKSIITDPTITIERKHGGVYSIPNVLHIMASSNSDWVVPAGDGARRFFVLDVNSSRAGDHTYFNALYQEANNGGIEALMEFLIRFDLASVNLRAVPVTAALQEQQERSLSLHAQWALDLADRADMQGRVGTITFGQTVLTRNLYDDYKAFATDRRIRPLAASSLGRWFTRIGLHEDRSSSHRQRILPSPEGFAQLVRDSTGVHE